MVLEGSAGCWRAMQDTAGCWMVLEYAGERCMVLKQQKSEVPESVVEPVPAPTVVLS